MTANLDVDLDLDLYRLAAQEAMSARSAETAEHLTAAQQQLGVLNSILDSMRQENAALKVSRVCSVCSSRGMGLVFLDIRYSYASPFLFLSFLMWYGQDCFIV
jgi:hypothetical protein